MWRTKLTYPNAVDSRDATILDTLGSLIPFPGGDRYVAWSDWLRAASDAGLIKPSEHYRLRNQVAVNL